VTAKAKRVTKADVVEALDREGARLLGIARGLGEERASGPIVGGWSARDVVAHCIYWQGMLARLMGVRHLPPPNWIPRWQSEQELGEDELNRLTVEHFKRYPFEDLLREFSFTADLVRRVVNEMKEENLVLPAGDPWGPDAQVWQAIASETHAHWKEHSDAIQARIAAAAAPDRDDGW
jgi:hypothetical protein